MALAVTMVERFPVLAADEPARISHDDELVLLFGEKPAPLAPLPDEAEEPGDEEVADGFAEEGVWYVIRRGDTLSSIALEQLGSAAHAKDLARLNALDDPDHLTPGDRIRLQ